MGKDAETATCFFLKCGMLAGITDGEALLCCGKDSCCCAGGATHIEACGLREVSRSLDLVPFLK